MNYKIKFLINFFFLFYLKYFSQVGYISRLFNYQMSFLLNYKDRKLRQFLFKSINLSHMQIFFLQTIQYSGFVKLKCNDFMSPLVIHNSLIEIADKYCNLSENDILERNRGKGKKYWLNLYDEKNHSFDFLNSIILNKSLIELISVYLSEVPRLQSISYMYSPANTDQSILVGSQNWHKDNDQKNRIKLFLSPYDIDINNGATTIYPANIKHNSYPNYPGYFNDEQAINSGMNISNIFPLNTKAGYFYLVDTSRVFHFGSRNNSKSRFLLIIDFGPSSYYLTKKNWNRSYPESKFKYLNNEILRLFLNNNKLI